MNLLEHYLKEIHSVKEAPKKEWMQEDWAKGKEWLLVDATFNCYGVCERSEELRTREDWEEIKRKGYYMG